MILLIIKKVFLYACPFALLFTQSKIALETEKTEKNAVESSKEDNQWIDTAELLTVIFALVVGAIYLLFTNMSNEIIKWLLLVFFIIMNASNVCLSFLTVKEVVGSSGNDELLSAELTGFGAMISVLFFAGLFNVPEMLIARAAQFKNVVFADLMQIIVYSAFLFLYLFLICAILPLPLSWASKKILSLYERSKRRDKKQNAIDSCIRIIESPVRGTCLLNKAVRKSREYRHFVLIIVISLSPVLFAADLIVLSISLILNFLLQVFGLLLFILSCLKQAIIGILTWLSVLSEKRMIALAFRVSLVAGIILVVIINRYDPLVKNVAESTAVLEFLASAVLIPMVFSWINEFKSGLRKIKNKHILESGKTDE